MATREHVRDTTAVLRPARKPYVFQAETHVEGRRAGISGAWSDRGGCWWLARSG